MLNYIRAELWKALHSRLARGLALFLAACAALFGVGMGLEADYAILVSGASVTMLTGMVAAPLLVQVVDGNRGATLKNELSFGLSRGRIYGGKLLAGLLLGLGLCALLLGGLLGIGWFTLPHIDPAAERTAPGVLGFSLLGALPIWYGMLALCHAMAVLISGTAVWTTIYYLAFFVGQPILVSLSSLLTGGQPAPLVEHIFMPYSLLMPPYLSGVLTWKHQLLCWAVGLGWGGVGTAAGLICFFRKEIK